MKKPFEPIIDKQLFFDPDWVSDPVPPWLRNLLDDRQLRDLARIKLDRLEAHLKADLASVAQIQKVIIG